MVDKKPEVSVEEISQKLAIKLLAGENNIKRKIKVSDLKRPGLELAGYWKHFVPERIHILGRTEISFLEGLDKEVLIERLEKFYNLNPRAVIVTRNIKPMDELIELANQYNIPLLQSELSTTRFISRLTAFLEDKLAPIIIEHGVLVDIYGLGILIRGKSGIGKSETAVELIKRGHRLVADDKINIRAIGERELIGTAPESIKHFLEMRGIGIINVKRLFGAGAVKDFTRIDMVVHLDKWKDDKSYERFGLDSYETEILGIKIPEITIPVRPGRNIALVLEVAAMNQRLNSMGYNAAEDLVKKINEKES
ncbi:MAG: HPr(Ser) kinase/phosphatase [Halarsenatibacteraceae bacterium]